ncbi:hypothetical protein MBAV_006037 [Candidatus Magnetobacterium bavaricum]|uniref:Uncharacterized protein n=1 Tax=Candidatus Magnetobacterium bavaricum TaxID=29290 RepID=A0A0F3GIX4_9BACT|nr:hypothetical protein MBAV_006037 [Candidatus Magnetobacterium bavaricum]
MAPLPCKGAIALDPIISHSIIMPKNSCHFSITCFTHPIYLAAKRYNTIAPGDLVSYDTDNGFFMVYNKTINDKGSLGTQNKTTYRS